MNSHVVATGIQKRTPARILEGSLPFTHPYPAPAQLLLLPDFDDDDLLFVRYGLATKAGCLSNSH